MISVLSVLIIAGILVLTRFRLEAISEKGQPEDEKTEKKKMIVED